MMKPLLMTCQNAGKCMLMMACIVFALTTVEATAVSPPKKPNIVLLLIDDMGYGDIAAHANPVLKTPNFDRLHRESLRFTDFLVSPTCSPTRAALMSGMHELKVGVTHTITGRNRMSLDAVILPQVLKRAGYHTATFGKWHLGMDVEEYRPYNRGFDLTPLFDDDLADWQGKDRMIVHHSTRWPDGKAAEHKYAFCGVRWGKYHLVRQYPCNNPHCGKDFRNSICKLD